MNKLIKELQEALNGRLDLKDKSYDENVIERERLKIKNIIDLAKINFEPITEALKVIKGYQVELLALQENAQLSIFDLKTK